MKALIWLFCVIIIAASWLWLIIIYDWQCLLVGVLITTCSMAVSASEVYHIMKRNRK